MSKIDFNKITDEQIALFKRNTRGLEVKFSGLEISYLGYNEKSKRIEAYLKAVDYSIVSVADEDLDLFA